MKYLDLILADLNGIVTNQPDSRVGVAKRIFSNKIKVSRLF